MSSDSSEPADPYELVAPFYDLAHRDFDADLELYNELARRLDRAVLELGCGTGRIAIDMARRGIRVVGLERSPAMLQLALMHARELGRLPLSLVRGDMQSLPLAGGFGLVLCSRDTFLHLTSVDAQISTLARARQVLAVRGLLVLDLPGPAADWADWAPGARPLTLDWTRSLEERTVMRLSSFTADAATQTRRVTDVYDVIAPQGGLRRHAVEYDLRFVFPEEMLLLLRAAGLELRDRYGGYELEPFDLASERMIVVAERSM